jgi:cbb3-type cytochrome oxidase maturation protein
MGLTWIAIAASLLMGGGALLIFIWAVRDQQFHSFEDVKYQVFWSDPELAQGTIATETNMEEQQDGRTTKDN